MKKSFMYHADFILNQEKDFMNVRITFNTGSSSDSAAMKLWCGQIKSTIKEFIDQQSDSKINDQALNTLAISLAELDNHKAAIANHQDIPAIQISVVDHNKPNDGTCHYMTKSEGEAISFEHRSHDYHTESPQRAGYNGLHAVSFPFLSESQAPGVVSGRLL